MTSPQRRQYSLRHLLLLMLVVGSILGWLREKQIRQRMIPRALHADVRSLALDLTAKLNEQAKANQELQVEVQHLQARLRSIVDDHDAAREMNRLIIDDPATTYVQQLRLLEEPLTWKFAVYLPPSRSRQLHVQLGAVSRHSLGKATNAQMRVKRMLVSAGNSTIEIGLNKSTGQWQCNITAADESVPIPLAFDASFGTTVDLGQQISQLAVSYEDSDKVRKAPAEEPMEVFRLSESGAAAASQEGIVVYFPAMAEPPQPSGDDLPQEIK